MKIIIYCLVIAIVLIVSIQALTDEQKEKIRNYHKECSAISGVDQELVQKARKGEFTDDPKLKEHLFCFSKKAGFQNDNGDLNMDVIKTKLGGEIKNDEETERIVTKCAVAKDTPQDTAFYTLKCYFESTQNHVSLA